MSLAQALSTYLTLNILIVIGFLGLSLFAFLARRSKTAVVELQLHYSVLLIVAAFTALHPFLPHAEVFTPAAKVWSAPSLRSFNDSAPDQGGYLSVPTPLGPSVMQADRVTKAWWTLTLLLLVCGGAFISRDLRTLLRIQRGAFSIRRVGRVRILVADAIDVPFSYWLPGQANIVLPSAMIEKPLDARMAIAHELQHHRHGDTRWIYMLWVLRLACPLNPALVFWNRWISELQEFACDETLVDRNKVESQAYARCLVEVAQSAIEKKFVPVCATGLTFLTERNLLHRRIEKMFSTANAKTGWQTRISVLGLMICAMGATAFASNGLVQDRRVTLTQATAMAAKFQGGPLGPDGRVDGFPVTVNDLVLKQLNRFVGTPEGREFMRNSLQRMKNYEALIAASSRRYGVPAEILAVPLIESGYQNLNERQSKTSGHAAGIWMFIPSTARLFGLVVDERRDERLDVPLNTDAAMRYFESNHLRFRDWLLSALAYNMGENAVQKGIEATGSRDAWTLIRSGYEGDKDYLPKLIAAMLIMKNPESVQ